MHEHLVQAGRVELGQVQADELRVRIVGGVTWLASALAAPSRLWLGGVVSAARDGALIRALLERVRSRGPVHAVLLCTDGLASYPSQALRLVRSPVWTGRRGRPRLALPAGALIAQAIKRYTRRRVAGIELRVVRGTLDAVTAALVRTQGRPTAVVNTAYIERLNATFRARLASLARRTRAGAHRPHTTEAGIRLVGAVYNVCRPQAAFANARPPTAHRPGVGSIAPRPRPPTRPISWAISVSPGFGHPDCRAVASPWHLTEQCSVPGQFGR